MKSNSHGDIIQRIDRIFDKVTNIITGKVLLAPCVVVLVAWVLLFGVFITGRALFNVNWAFVEEFSAYCLVLCASFSLAYTLRTGGHVKVGFVTKLLSKRVRSILAVTTDLIALVMVVYLTQKLAAWFWYGFVDEIRSVYPSNVLVWPVYLLVPLGLSFLGLELLREVYCGVIRLMRGDQESEKG